MNKQTIRGIQKERDEVAQRLNDAVKSVYPIGSTVNFYKGLGWITAKILDFYPSWVASREPEFLIRSHTGKEYRITLFWIMHDLKGGDA